jgi:hypothetical protein
MKKLIITMALIAQFFVTSACEICGIEMNAISAKLDYAYKIGTITERERNCYENGFIEAINIMITNHPNKE